MWANYNTAAATGLSGVSPSRGYRKTEDKKAMSEKQIFPL